MHLVLQGDNDKAIEGTWMIAFDSQSEAKSIMDFLSSQIYKQGVVVIKESEAENDND